VRFTRRNVGRNFAVQDYRMSDAMLVWILAAIVLLDILAVWFGADSRSWVDPSSASWPGF
jgi:hypothetical protein